MTKSYLFFTLLLAGIFPLSVCGQEVESRVYQENSSVVEGDSVAFGEALVDLAWEHYPQNEAYKLEVLREKESISQARWDWLDGMNVSFNINEGNISNEINPNLFFPRYNFRFSISAGTFINLPSEVKQAKIRRDIAEENVSQQRLIIRREVLSRYYTYLYNINLLKLRHQSYQDVYSSYTSATQSFRRGEISIDEYNKALVAKDGAQEARYLAERELLLSRLLLEEVIGMSLNRARDVISNKRN